MTREAWATSNRRAELPPDWWRIRERVKRRAGGRCEWVTEESGRCPVQGTDCDHISDPDDHSDSNLQWLCSPHHRVKTQQDSAATRAKLKHPTSTHPGLR